MFYFHYSIPLQICHHIFLLSGKILVAFRRIIMYSVSGKKKYNFFGGKTPNSEWEFLTNNTLAMFPYGTIPFQQFILDVIRLRKEKKNEEANLFTLSMKGNTMNVELSFINLLARTISLLLHMRLLCRL